MGDLTTHFSTHEFHCKGRGVKGHKFHQTLVDPPLLVVLEALRSTVGRPLTIVSGDRCRWWNRRVHGAEDSRHFHHDAADIPREYARLAQAMDAGARGIGIREGWVTHIDTRPGPLTVWQYEN